MSRGFLQAELTDLKKRWRQAQSLTVIVSSPSLLSGDSLQFGTFCMWSLRESRPSNFEARCWQRCAAWPLKSEAWHSAVQVGSLKQQMGKLEARGSLGL